ncbi:MAG TPA: NAD+ synthase [Candidatus Omnitrophota bacterium]|nr:NAD+ synthase [Candidatus Omnitrophota bacterium]
MHTKIVKWLKRQVAGAGAQGVVLGLSGGIDSCVVAVLARRALGAKKVLALFLPCHSQPQDKKDARLLARKFGIQLTTVDLTGTYDTLVAALPAADRMTRANIRPRLRMITLYYFARKFNYLVAGTSNKSEILTGYFTKFGDGASDLLPLGNLYKSQVRKLAREIGIPEPIIAKPPTAGLWANQTDEGEMGITYPELDDILSRMEKRQKQVVSADKVKRVKLLMKRSEHKRLKTRACQV